MEPLVFEPYFRPQVWGQRRLERLLGKPLPSDEPFGEAWVVSAHPHHVSRVAEGPHQGANLADLCTRHAAALFGHSAPADRQFPLLLKFLDCHAQLSVQVHPTDELARQLSRERAGKTEAWVVLEVEVGGRIYAGLRPGVRRAELERHLEAGTTDQCLHSFTPQLGDCVFLPAGTVHAVGGGVVMAEVQQSSDATFRLFDWNRLGSDGQPRTLHIRESLASIDWEAGPVRPVAGTLIPGLPAGVHAEQLVRCAYFHMDRFYLAGSLEQPYPKQLSLWVVLEGEAELRGTPAGYRRTFRRGETVLVPATAGPLHWHAGSATLLGVRPVVARS
jgi:mannose-6-phosphate isomerase